MAIEIRPDNSLATRLHAHLIPKLRGGIEKRIDDGLWIDFDDAGNVSLGEKPYDFLSYIWEMLMRLFTGKYAKIERGISLITAEVNEYLVHENDPIRFGAFINNYTPLVAELYRCAIKMARVQRIGREVLDHLEARVKIQELMAPYEHLGVPDRRYKFHGLFSVSSEMVDAAARFRFSDQDGLVGGHGIEAPRGLEHNQILSCDIKSRGNPVSIVAEVTRNFALMADENSQIFLSPNGDAPDVRNIEGQNGLSFYNGSEHEVRVKISHLADDHGEFILSPGEISAGIPRSEEMPGILHFSIMFRTETPLFTISSPMAHYLVKVDRVGNLNLKVTPLRTRLMNLPLDIQVPFNQMYELRNRDHFFEMAVLRGTREIKERVFVPQGSIFQRDHNTLRNLFGVEWNGTLQVTYQYPEPILSSPIMPTPPRLLVNNE